MSRAAVIAAAALLPGCCLINPPASGDKAADTQAASAAAPARACPWSLRTASAWINRMPGPGRDADDANLHVLLRLDGDGVAHLTRHAGTTPDTLVLSLSHAPHSDARPGGAAYREPAPQPPYQSVSIFCEGAEIVRIPSIRTVR